MSKRLLKITDKGQGCSMVHFHNGVHIGDLLVGDDGYWGWWPSTSINGFMPDYVLQELAYIIKRRNAEWDAIVQGGVGEGAPTDLWPIHIGSVVVGGINLVSKLRVDSCGPQYLSMAEVTALRNALSKSLVRMQEIQKWR